MVISIIVYLSAACLLSYFGYMAYRVSSFYHSNKLLISQPYYDKVDNKEKIKIILNPFPIFILLAYCLLFSLRFRVGSDCETYVQDYSYLINDRVYFCEGKYESGFLLITKILSSIGFGRIGFLFVFGFIQISLFLLTFRSRKLLLPFLMFILMTGPFFLSWTNGMRQITAGMLFLYASKILIDNNNRLIYILLILLATTIHKSAVILLPFAFLPLFNIYKYTYVLLALSVCTIVLGQMAFLRDYLQDMDTLISFLGYDDYAKGLDNLLNEDNNTKFGPRRIITSIFALLTIIYAKQINAFSKDKFFIYSFNMFLLSFFFKDNLLSNLQFEFARPFLYFDVFELICFAYLLLFFMKKYGWRSFQFLALTALSFGYILIVCMTGAGMPDETLLYKCILFHPEGFYTVI